MLWSHIAYEARDELSGIFAETGSLYPSAFNFAITTFWARVTGWPWLNFRDTKNIHSSGIFG